MSGKSEPAQSHGPEVEVTVKAEKANGGDGGKDDEAV